MTDSHKPHMAPQKVILLKMLTMLVCLIVAAVIFVMWAKGDTKTQLAEDVREFVGLPHPVKVLDPVPVVESEPEPEPEPEPDPEPVVESPPVTTEMSYETFVGRPDLWPDVLELTLETSVPILYREHDFGTMSFVPGQIMKVETILDTTEVIGSVNGNYLIVPAEKTSLLPWFHDQYRGKHFMRYPNVMDSTADSNDDDGSFKIDLLEGMRKWCKHNFRDCTFDITDDALVLRWRPERGIVVDYRVEAQMVAREYLMRQAALGSIENYAPCEIYHLSTGRLLGTGSFYLLSLQAQEYR